MSEPASSGRCKQATHSLSSASTNTNFGRIVSKHACSFRRYATLLGSCHPPSEPVLYMLSGPFALTLGSKTVMLLPMVSAAILSFLRHPATLHACLFHAFKKRTACLNGGVRSHTDARIMIQCRRKPPIAMARSPQLARTCVTPQGPMMIDPAYLKIFRAPPGYTVFQKLLARFGNEGISREISALHTDFGPLVYLCQV